MFSPCRVTRLHVWVAPFQDRVLQDEKSWERPASRHGPSGGARKIPQPQASTTSLNCHEARGVASTRKLATRPLEIDAGEWARGVLDSRRSAPADPEWSAVCQSKIPPHGGLQEYALPVQAPNGPRPSFRLRGGRNAVSSFASCGLHGQMTPWSCVAVATAHS
jgi:hypothetical protein